MEGVEGVDGGGSITLGVDENALSLSPEQIRILSEMNEKGQLEFAGPSGKFWIAQISYRKSSIRSMEEIAVRAAAIFQMEMNAKQFDSGDESTP